MAKTKYVFPVMAMKNSVMANKKYPVTAKKKYPVMAEKKVALLWPRCRRKWRCCSSASALRPQGSRVQSPLRGGLCPVICLCQVTRGATSRIEGGGAMWLLSLVLFVCLSRGVLSGLARLIALSYE